MVCGRFELAIKDPSTSEQRYKARFVISGLRDSDKSILVHAYANLRLESVRLLIAIALIMGFTLRAQDISQAYLRDASELILDVYAPTTQEFYLPR